MIPQISVISFKFRNRKIICCTAGLFSNPLLLNHVGGPRAPHAFSKQSQHGNPNVAEPVASCKTVLNGHSDVLTIIGNVMEMAKRKKGHFALGTTCDQDAMYFTTLWTIHVGEELATNGWKAFIRSPRAERVRLVVLLGPAV